MTTPTPVVLDGVNLALPHGTGIATYARTLAALLASAGHPVDVLYERDVSAAAVYDDVMREVLFFSTESNQSTRRLPSVLRQLSRLRSRGKNGLALLLRMAHGITPTRVTMDMVVGSDAMPSHPGDAGFLTARAAYRDARISFRLTSRPMTVRLPIDTALHLTQMQPLLAHNAPTIMTVHDAIPLRMPYTIEGPAVPFLRQLRIMAPQVTRLLTVSETSRRDIAQVLGWSEDRISVTYQPVDLPALWDAAAMQRIVEAVYRVEPQQYFLFTGAIEPKKNLPRLIESYLSSGTDKPLLIAGPKGWLVDGQLAALKDKQDKKGRRLKGKKGPAIIQLGYVPRMHLFSLIAQARALFFPSLYEGFGLPMLEAMHFGTPVMAGSAGSLPEIAGGSALMVDPYDANAMTNAIIALDADADMRAHLRAAGIANAKRFTPAACYPMIADAYRAAGVSLNPTPAAPCTAISPALVRS